MHARYRPGSSESKPIPRPESMPNGRWLFFRSPLVWFAPSSRHHRQRERAPLPPSRKTIRDPKTDRHWARSRVAIDADALEGISSARQQVPPPPHPSPRIPECTHAKTEPMKPDRSCTTSRLSISSQCRKPEAKPADQSHTPIRMISAEYFPCRSLTQAKPPTYPPTRDARVNHDGSSNVKE